MTRSGGEPNMADTATSRSAPRSIARTNELDRKSTRLNSSHANISYAVFCLKKKKHNNTRLRHDHELRAQPILHGTELQLLHAARAGSVTAYCEGVYVSVHRVISRDEQLQMY